MSIVRRECPKCHGSGFAKDADGTCHTCWDCLAAGNMDVHSKEVKDSGLKI